MRNYAIILASGEGSRMGKSFPKQFMNLKGKPVLFHTIEKFSQVKRLEIILVLKSDQTSLWKDLCFKYNFSIPHKICIGGSTRPQSVKKGLALCKKKSIIAIHDGVRPLVSIKLINKIYALAETHDAVVPAVPCHDSVRLFNSKKNLPLNRNDVFMIQTPQCFKSEVILEAYNKIKLDGFTDDASVVQQSGVSIFLTEGEKENIKITFPEDLKIANCLI